MNVNAFIVTVIMSIFIFAVPAKMKWFYAFALQLIVSAITGWAAVEVLIKDTGTIVLPFVNLVGNQINIVIDGLSAFFLLVVNFTAITGGLYAFGYLKQYAESKNSTEFSIHHFSFFGLHLSMVLACMLRDGMAFLISTMERSKHCW